VRFVTINMFETVFDEITWDIHGSKPFTDIQEMSKLVAPNFDQAYSTLLEDLKERGLLDKTMVLAMGEFGRTPKVNPAGGRDHHPGAWTILMGGGPIKGGQIIGESDELGYAPKSRPVTPAEVAATLFKGLGLDPHKDIQRKLTVRADLFLVGEVEGAIIGTVMAGYEGHRGWINYLGVDPAFRRRGLGRVLMQEAERHLREAGCPKINLQVRSANTDAINFYRSIGFAVDDVVSMGKRLEQDG